MASALLAPGAAFAESMIKISTRATLGGRFTVLGQDGMHGVNFALKSTT
jgi:hypothetical protein